MLSPDSFLKKSPVHSRRIIEREIVSNAVEVHARPQLFLVGLCQPIFPGMIGVLERLFFKSIPVEPVHLDFF